MKKRIILCTIILTFATAVPFLFCSCTSNHKEPVKQQPKQQQEPVKEPAPAYQPPTYPTESHDVIETPVKEETNKVESQTTNEREQCDACIDIAERGGVRRSQTEQRQKPIEEPKLSRYYEEGYDNGYDDGEDDAVMDNGWGGQYDDQCRYKGKKRKEYQLGYEEGYEAGYYDNKDSDE